VTAEEFRVLFPEGQDIAFADELRERLGERRAGSLLERMWRRPVWKPTAKGIHGTLFFELEAKKAWYPTRRELDVDPSCINDAQRRLYARKRRERERALRPASRSRRPLGR
jgi:hypothetical protein